jgi:hypothetical protein
MENNKPESYERIICVSLSPPGSESLNAARALPAPRGAYLDTFQDEKRNFLASPAPKDYMRERAAWSAAWPEYRLRFIRREKIKRSRSKEKLLH